MKMIDDRKAALVEFYDWLRIYAQADDYFPDELLQVLERTSGPVSGILRIGHTIALRTVAKKAEQLLGLRREDDEG